MSEPLATVDDLAARMQRTLSDDEQIRAYYLLVDASATVRNYCRRDFTSDETTERVRVRNGRLRLPNGPVTAVTSISDMDGNDVSFTWYSGDVIDFSVLGQSEWVINPYSTPLQWVDVTYTHGYDQIPDTIIAVVCRLAATAMDTPSEDAGKSSESIAGYSYTNGAIAASGGLFGEEKSQLDAFRIVGGTSRIAS